MIKEKSKAWEKFTQKLGAIFAKLPVSPNFITWLTLPAAVFGFIAIAIQHPLLGTCLFLCAGVLDIIDGPVARHLGISSGYGAFLDGSLDRVVDFLVIFSYFWIPLQPDWLSASQWITIAVFLAIIPSFEVAYANHRKAVDDPDEKLIWRILNRGEMYILMLAVIVASIFNPTWAGNLLIALVLLSAITSLQTFVTTLYLSRLPNPN